MVEPNLSQAQSKVSKEGTRWICSYTSPDGIGTKSAGIFEETSHEKQFQGLFGFSVYLHWNFHFQEVKLEESSKLLPLVNRWFDFSG